MITNFKTWFTRRHQRKVTQPHETYMGLALTRNNLPRIIAWYAMVEGIPYDALPSTLKAHYRTAALSLGSENINE